MISNAFGSFLSALSGCCHSNVLSIANPHRHLIQLSLSNELDIAYASALNVDLTTLPICLEFQATGEKSVDSFCANLLVHAIMNNPCCALSCEADAKLASPKLANVISFSGIGRIVMEVDSVFLASLSTLFPSKRDSTVALQIDFCTMDTFAAKSGRLLTAAYCSDPHKALSC